MIHWCFKRKIINGKLSTAMFHYQRVPRHFMNRCGESPSFRRSFSRRTKAPYFHRQNATSGTTRKQHQNPISDKNIPTGSISYPIHISFIFIIYPFLLVIHPNLPWFFLMIYSHLSSITTYHQKKCWLSTISPGKIESMTIFRAPNFHVKEALFDSLCCLC